MDSQHASRGGTGGSGAPLRPPSGSLRTRPLPLTPAVAAAVERAEFEELRERSLLDPEGFWGERAACVLDWTVGWDEVIRGGFGDHGPHWFAGGRLNAAYNCVDRHVLAGHGDKPAIVFEDLDGEHEAYTYQRLRDETARFAQVLRDCGVKRGEVVVLYMPMIAELPIAMLACARLGAVHSVVFGGHSGQALAQRVESLRATVIVTADTAWRRGAPRSLKQETDAALGDAKGVRHVVVVGSREAGDRRDPADRGHGPTSGRDVWLGEALAAQAGSPDVACEAVEATEPLFVCWTSGSSGRPKGVVHAVGGYLLYAAETYASVFATPDGAHFCIADMAWITAHTYLLYGPLAMGATTVLYEGAATDTRPERLFEIMDRNGVATVCATPLVVQGISAAGEDWGARHQGSQPRVAVSTGDPISSGACAWLRGVTGGSQCQVLDAWWETETGGILLLRQLTDDGATGDEPARPLVGIEPVVLDRNGAPARPGEVGDLCISRPWPGIASSILDDAGENPPQASLGSSLGAVYRSGDQASSDDEGGFRIVGAAGDDAWVWGQRVSTSELERVLMDDPRVVEAAVVGYPEPTKGEGIYCYVVLSRDAEPSAALTAALCRRVVDAVGPFAMPDKVQCVRALPRARTGKLIRRILRKFAEGDAADFGDTSTLDDPSTVEDLSDEAIAPVWTIPAEAKP
jgi:acetyl-CoA synthetase